MLQHVHGCAFSIKKYNFNVNNVHANLRNKNQIPTKSFKKRTNQLIKQIKQTFPQSTGTFCSLTKEFYHSTEPLAQENRQ